MAFKLLPKTRENTTTVGTGALVLAGAVAPDNLTFGAQMSEGDTTFACAMSSDGTTWEEGLYTMTSGTLARTGARLANSAITTSNVALDGGRVWGIIPNDILLLLAKLVIPADAEVLKYDAAAGRFVAGSVGGATWHAAVALATAAALPTNSYSNGTSGVGATLTASSNGALSVDGVAVSVGNRILVKDEAAAAHNGIYVVTAAGDGSHHYVLTRATDYDGAADIAQSDITITGPAGSANASTVWRATLDAPFTLGTDDVNWDLSITLPPLTSDGDVLTIVSGAVAWATPAGGGGGGDMTLIETKTGNNTSDHFSFQGLSGFQIYKLIAVQIRPASNANALMVFGEGATPTYITAAYDFNGMYQGAGGSGIAQGTSAAAATLTGNVRPNLPGLCFDLTIHVDDTNQLVRYTGTISVLNNDTNFYWLGVCGGVDFATGGNFSAIKFFLSGSVNIQSGIMSLYGLST